MERYSASSTSYAEYISSGAVVSMKSWTHVALVVSSSGTTLTVKIYTNGNLIQSKGEDAGEATSLAAGTLKIGYRTGSTDLYSGFIAYLKMYRAARTQT